MTPTPRPASPGSGPAGSPRIPPPGTRAARIARGLGRGSAAARSRRQPSASFRAMPGPELSVVVSTLGNYDVLRRVLDGYSGQDAPPESFEVVVAMDRA